MLQRYSLEAFRTQVVSSLLPSLFHDRHAHVRSHMPRTPLVSTRTPLSVQGNVCTLCFANGDTLIAAGWTPACLSRQSVARRVTETWWLEGQGLQMRGESCGEKLAAKRVW